MNLRLYRAAPFGDVFPALFGGDVFPSQHFQQLVSLYECEAQFSCRALRDQVVMESKTGKLLQLTTLKTTFPPPMDSVLWKVLWDQSM